MPTPRVSVQTISLKAGRVGILLSLLRTCAVGILFALSVFLLPRAGSGITFPLLSNEKTKAGTDTTPPTAPTNLKASVISSSQINLTWTASTDNVGVTNYKVFRNNVQVGQNLNPSFNNTGLTANTTYTYYVIAYDAAGNASPQSASVSATTARSATTTVPNVAVSNVAVSNVHTSSSTSFTTPAASSPSIGAYEPGSLPGIRVSWPPLLPSGLRQYYVSPNGSDANSGSQSSPWLTINHAAWAIPSGAGAIIHVARGDYNLTSATCIVVPQRAKRIRAGRLPFRYA